MTEQITIANDDDINELRNALRNLAENGGFSDYETTKLVTAASELARNVRDYAGEGRVTLDVPSEGASGVRVVFEDDGPGIENVDRAMEDGFSGPESRGLGVGLPGAERLSDKFDIESTQGVGTRVSLTIHKNPS